MNFLKITLATVIFIMSFTIQSNVAKAQSCPSGFSYYEVPMLINGCNYIVQYCVKCANGPYPAELEIKGFILTQGNQQWTFQQVTNYIYNTSSNYQFIVDMFCTNDDVPPCEFSSGTFIVKEWMCWNVVKFNYFGDIVYKYKPCDNNSYCEKEITQCWDEDDNVMRIYVINTTIVGEYNCTLGAEEVPLPTELDKPSECFIYATDCM